MKVVVEVVVVVLVVFISRVYPCGFLHFFSPYNAPLLFFHLRLLYFQTFLFYHFPFTYIVYSTFFHRLDRFFRCPRFAASPDYSMSFPVVFRPSVLPSGTSLSCATSFLTTRATVFPYRQSYPPRRMWPAAILSYAVSHLHEVEMFDSDSIL